MRLSPTLSGYIGRQFLLAFASVLAVILGVVFLFDVIELIRRAAGRGDLGVANLLLMAVLKLPQMLHTVLPFAVLIGAMTAFWRLTRTHELVVARSAGISAWQFLTPVLVLVAGMGVIELTAFNPLAAAMYGRFQKMEDEILLGKTSSLDVSEVGLWLREGDADRQIVLHADQVQQQALTLNLRGVHVFILDSNEHFTRRLSARTGTLADGSLELGDVWEMEGGKASVHHAAMTVRTELTLERVHDNFASPETMSFWQLPAFITFFEKAGFAATKHRMHFQSLLASPLLYCAMVLVAAVFSLRPNMRAGGLLMRVGGGVAAGFGIYFFNKIIYAFGLSATLPQGLAAWSPALVAGLIGVSGLLHLEDG
ncbi:LPS export ABC transporter permease LptG [Magnetospirillum sulfuroxidans]|uniref:LPS export ABC transporter permease LptG n=1 Tax=Magnetospirillum sulfuroxidans TaxID=611300 RepID=A0ABS5IBM2_9PROT|nr:LPS export ABC transporter permease LptG [Magnetospirillum sulfuroxidans]MBR9971827.1 LPS export ABC transporter permease LptG [Magnetospirillum sulfuroxidans]